MTSVEVDAHSDSDDDDTIPADVASKATSSLRRLAVLFIALNVFAVGSFLVFLNWASSVQEEHEQRYIPVRASLSLRLA